MPAPAIFIPSRLNDLGMDVDLSALPAQGSLFYRGASKWNDLAPGAAGEFLQSDGNGGLLWSQIDLSAYATTSALSSGLAGKVNKSGDTMTGALVLSGAPSSDLHASTKKYVDDSVAAIPAGITDHGALSGLSDDDHPQYLNTTRGDARYSLLGHTHAAPAHSALSGLDADDHLQYFNQARGDLRYSLLGHNHDSAYSPLGHTHAHSGLSGLSADDHTQYHNDSRGDLRYLKLTGGTLSARLTLAAAPTATASYGLLSLGSGPFDGSTTGFFVGAAAGTVIAANQASGGSANFLDFQTAGTLKFRVTKDGNTMTPFLSNLSGTATIDLPSAGSMTFTVANNQKAIFTSAGSCNTEQIGNDFANYHLWSEYDDGTGGGMPVFNWGYRKSGSTPRQSWYAGMHPTAGDLRFGYTTLSWGAPGDGDRLNLSPAGVLTLGNGTTAQAILVTPGANASIGVQGTGTHLSMSSTTNTTTLGQSGITFSSAAAGSLFTSAPRQLISWTGSATNDATQAALTIKPSAAILANYQALRVEPSGSTTPVFTVDTTGKVVASALQIPTGASSGYVLTSDGSGNATWAAASGGGGGGVTDHGALTGLADDDHTQYFNTTRGDARYLQLSGGTLTGGLTTSGMLRAQGTVVETATGTDRLDIGVQAGSPRMVFEDAGFTIWEIDNDAGTFRWYTPGTVRMSLSTTAFTLNLPATFNNGLSTSTSSFLTANGKAQFVHVGASTNDSNQDAVRIQPSGALSSFYRPLAVYLSSGATTPAAYINNKGVVVALGHRTTPVALSAGATVNTDAANGDVFRLSYNANFTLAAPTNPSDGQVVKWRLKNTGASAITPTPTVGTGGFRFGSDITGLSDIAAGKTDYLSAMYDSTDNVWDVFAYVKGY